MLAIASRRNHRRLLPARRRTSWIRSTTSGARQMRIAGGALLERAAGEHQRPGTFLQPDSVGSVIGAERYSLQAIEIGLGLVELLIRFVRDIDVEREPKVGSGDAKAVMMTAGHEHPAGTHTLVRERSRATSQWKWPSNTFHTGVNTRLSLPSPRGSRPRAGREMRGPAATSATFVGRRSRRSSGLLGVHARSHEADVHLQVVGQERKPERHAYPIPRRAPAAKPLIERERRTAVSRIELTFEMHFSLPWGRCEIVGNACAG